RRNDDDVAGRAGANGVDEALHDRLERRPRRGRLGRLVEWLVDDVRVVREARGNVGPERARIRRRGAGGDDVDLVEVDDHVEVLAGGVVDGGRQYATDVVGGAERHLRRATGRRPGADRIGQW